MIEPFDIKIIPYTLQFKKPVGTSRGVYYDHKIWYVVLRSRINSKRWGIGEAAPLFDLSCDYDSTYEQKLVVACNKLESAQQLDKESLRNFPSILFALEVALKQYETESFHLWHTPFSKGDAGIPINGLIWMGSYSEMLEQIEKKMQLGFHCIKLKIGAINFDDELKLLKFIRKHFSSEQITLRVDANGGFTSQDALDKLKQLSELEIHSIEQPIKAGQWDEMFRLAQSTPLPIALDEELIGINDFSKKRDMLISTRPQYIILKPTLHGGIMGAEEWIELAEELGIDWWITSALESNIGLNAIAQWCSTFNTSIHQGLGTGGLYTNNVQMPLEIRGDALWFDPKGKYFSVEDLCIN